MKTEAIIKILILKVSEYIRINLVLVHKIITQKI